LLFSRFVFMWRERNRSSSRKPRRNHSCVTRCAVQDPPFWRGFSLSGADSGRLLGFRARSGLRHTSGFTSRQEGFAMQLRGHHLEPRSGLITGDFAYRNAPIPPLCRGKKIAKWVIFSRTHLLSEPDLRLFLRDRHVIGLSRLFRSLLIPLGISVESPVLEIACLDSRSGLILGESHRDFSDIVGILDRLDYGVARSRFESSMFWNHGWNIRL